VSNVVFLGKKMRACTCTHITERERERTGWGPSDTAARR
jgi:hypothetical protein